MERDQFEGWRGSIVKIVERSQSYHLVCLTLEQGTHGFAANQFCVCAILG